MAVACPVCHSAADLLLLDTRDERDLGVEIAGPGPIGMMLGGAWQDFAWKG